MKKNRIAQWIRSRTQTPPVVSLISLGCSKNTVDSELILGRFIECGWMVAEKPSDADVCLVNTCGFVQDARDETASVLREVCAADGTRPYKTVALGCLVQRAAGCPEMQSFLDAADACFSFDQYDALPELCHALLGNARSEGEDHAGGERYIDFLRRPRLRFGSPHSAYLKLAEGCSNGCSFCSIPLIRGPMVSRPVNDILLEAGQLVSSGALELNLIAQDTAAYGMDRPGDPRLPDLLRALRDGISEPVWFRLLYACPHHLTREVLEVMASDKRFCPYLDLPLQHISDRMLRRMGRPLNRVQTEAKLDEIAEVIPDAAIRTSFITGHPGEKEEDFEEVLDFLRKRRFMHVGVFAYSEEPGTQSAGMTPSIDPEVRQERCRLLIEEQRMISASLCGMQVGRTEEVLVDSSEAAMTVARTQRQAPEVDGEVLIADCDAAPGTRLTVRVVGAGEYDLIAEPVRRTSDSSSGLVPHRSDARAPRPRRG